MRFNINLASLPYEDAGQFYRRWIPILLVLAVLTLGLTAKAISVYRESRKTDREIAKIDQRLSELDKQRQQASATLARPENSGTRDTAQFLNTAFQLKSFSWTQVLSDLEQLVPQGVQVVSIKPKLLENGQLQCEMQVVANQRPNVIELVRRMETSPRFLSATIVSEKNTDKGLVADIQATYVRSRAQ
jgi:type IV pilus assembly protein PilN